MIILHMCDFYLIMANYYAFMEYFIENLKLKIRPSTLLHLQVMYQKNLLYSQAKAL